MRDRIGLLFLQMQEGNPYEYIGGRAVVGDHGEEYDDDINGKMRTALGPDRTWAEEGSCMPHHNNGADLSGLFYPEDGEGEASPIAPVICASCPVKAACLAYGILTRASAGVWGGVDFGAMSRRKRSEVLGTPRWA